MSPDLDALLCARYPVMLRRRSLQPEESPLGWGFTCGDGWFLIIDALLTRLQIEADFRRTPQPVVSQIKEKLGYMRCRLHSGRTLRTTRLIYLASARSLKTCERCGAPGRLLSESTKLAVRCKQHAEAGSTVVPAHFV